MLLLRPTLPLPDDPQRLESKVLPHFTVPQVLLQHRTCVCWSQKVPTPWAVQKDWPQELNDPCAVRDDSVSQPSLTSAGFISCSWLGTKV